MRVDDMVRTGTEASAASADMASNRVTDAVNSGIVDSADKSHMAIKDSFLGPDRNSPEAQHGYGVESTDGFSREGAVTFGSEAQRQADKLVSSGSVAKHAADALKQTGGKIAADGLVSSKADGRKLVSKANLKKAAKGAAVSEALRDSEFDGADEYYYKAKGAWKLGRKGADVVKKHAAARKAGNVSSGAGKATKVIEKKSTKKTGQAAQRAAQSARNQRMAMAAAQEAKAAGGAAKALAAKGGGAAVAASGGGLGGVLAAIGSAFLPVIGTVALILLLIIVILTAIGGQNKDTNVGALTGNEAIIAQALLDQGFSKAAVAGVLGNIANEGNPGSDENMDGMFNYAYERACGMFQYTHASNSTPPYYSHGCEYCHYKRWCSDNNLDWADLHNQMDWTFGGAGEKFGHSWKNQWQMRRTYYVGYWGAKYSWLNSSTLCSADDFPKLDDPAVAAYCWMAAYEGPVTGATAHLDRRIESAQHYYDLLNTSVSVGEGGGFTEVVSRAQAQMGKPYQWGAAGPNSYDCSGLVSYALTGRYEHTWVTQYIYYGGKPFREISASEAVPGDVVCKESHTGIYIGNGQMIHAPHTGDVVKIGPVQSGMKYFRYEG
jgi:hypothetical protein